MRRELQFVLSLFMHFWGITTMLCILKGDVGGVVFFGIGTALLMLSHYSAMKGAGK